MANRFVYAIAAFLLLSTVTYGKVMAHSYENHTGSYLYAMFGGTTVSHDTNPRNNTKFGSALELAYGFTYGYNITNWIAPEIQFTYGTVKDTTFSGSSAREHFLIARVNGKVSFLTGADFNKNRTWKFYPYAKGGAVAHGLYINSPVVNDKVGTWGYGGTFGGGLEVLYKYLYLGVDINNDLVGLKSETKTIAGTPTRILAGGFKYLFSAYGTVGVHF